MNRKNGNENGYRPSFEGKTHRNNVVKADINEKSVMANAKDGASGPENNKADVLRNKRMPEPPPNYRGMIYDGYTDDVVGAEGLDRLAGNDKSYSEYGKNRREDIQRRLPEVPVMSRDEADRGDDCDTGGLSRLVEGMRAKSFSPEDILLCAMILLMLNTGSDDDILMVLVLAMLL